MKTENPYLHHPNTAEATAQDWTVWKELESDLGLEPLEIPLSWISEDDPRRCSICHGIHTGFRCPLKK